jgi:MoaA/NifB/PqqE/SkfB family radical SAM enzyme
MFKKILTKSGLIVYDTENLITIRYDRNETNKLLEEQIDYDKLDDFCEVVHLEISNKCNLNCKYCYKEKETKQATNQQQELKIEDWFKVIDSLVEYNIFQVTFGGGEPLMREDMPILLDYCIKKDLNVAITTNGILLSSFSKDALSKFKQINISYHGDLQNLELCLRQLFDYKITAGINYVLSREYVKDLIYVMRLAKQYDAEVLFLTYKPVIGDTDNVIDSDIVYSYAFQYSKHGYKTAVDGLSCFGKNDEYCLQKKRFADIASNGDVYPCSFIRKSIGNVLEKSFAEIWRDRGEQIKCLYIKEKK